MIQQRNPIWFPRFEATTGKNCFFAKLRNLLILLACCPLFTSVAFAGGGPENVVVVVNQNSWASKTVANHFLQLRRIPSCNVVHIDWDQGVETTDVETFRTQILGPVLSTIADRNLDSQIDYIIYSVDFPFEIRINEDLEGHDAPQQITPSGSITGLTYCWEWVTARNPSYVRMDANAYFSPDKSGVPDSRGFRSWFGWGKDGKLIEAGGQHYALSTMLGVTSGRGNTLNEVIECLRRGAEADATVPSGTIYFMRNDDVRSKVRDSKFDLAANTLEQLGVRAEVLQGVTPQRKPDVQGAVLGTHTVDWGRSQSTILPGAICEHFTSFGGMLQEKASQTPLSEFIRYGAAGTSGTVIEPYAIHMKFPSAFMQVHYARGCSLAESFYQAVAGPYQLLIVGDPLCRPWATIPLIDCEGLTPGETLSGIVSFQPTARTIGSPVDRFELFVDGQRHSACSSEQTIEFDTRTLLDGFHEFRIIGIEAGAIETQGSITAGMTVDNHGRSATLTSQRDVALWGEPFKLQIAAPGAELVVIYHNKRRIASMRGESGTVTLEPEELGLGPVTLEALALGSGGPSSHVLTTPLEIDVYPGEPLPGFKPPRDKSPGWVFESDSGVRSVVRDFSSGDWLGDAGGKLDEGFRIRGALSITAQDVYQFNLQHRGHLILKVDDQVVLESDSAKKGGSEMNIVPVNLAAGSHQVELSLSPTPQTRLNLQFGPQTGFNGAGVRSIRGRQFWHTN